LTFEPNDNVQAARQPPMARDPTSRKHPDMPEVAWNAILNQGSSPGVQDGRLPNTLPGGIEEMVRHKKVQIQKPYRPIYPTPAGLVTSVSKTGEANIITLGEIFNISIRKPIIIGIAIREATYSHGLITDTREFTVNLPTADMIEAVLGCGSVSGRTGISKFDRFGLTPIPARYVKPPLIAECPVNLECKVIDITTVGDHDLFLGEMVAQHVDENAVDDDGSIIVEELKAFSFVLGEFWDHKQCIGRH